MRPQHNAIDEPPADDQPACRLRITLLEAYAPFAEVVREFLETEGYQVSIATTVDAARFTMRTSGANLLLVDLPLREAADLWGLLLELHSRPRASCLPVVGYSSSPDLLRACEPVLRDCGILLMPKPFDLEDLLCTIGQALHVAVLPA